MSKTAGEIIKIIKDNDLQEQIFNYEDYSEEITEELGEFEIKESICNSDEMYIIIYFIKPNIYLKLTGEYDSYGGGEHYYYGSIREVKPKEVQKIIYENI